MTTKSKATPQLKLGETPLGQKIRAPGLAPAGLDTEVYVPGADTRRLDPHIEGEPLWQGGLCIACGGSGHFGPHKREDGTFANLACDKCDGCGDRPTWLVRHGKVPA